MIYRNIFRSKIINIFNKFFINLLSGYTQYLLISPDNNYFGYNIRDKLRRKKGSLFYIKEIFNIEEYFNTISNDYKIFYAVFFKTELFHNFIRNILYPENEIDSLRHKYFDFLTFLKKEKDKRKSEEFDEQYQKYKMPFGLKNNNEKIDIIISDKLFFNNEEKIILDEKGNEALEKYYQLITKKDNIYSFKYFLFPKLLFDNKFFNIDYNIQFYRHFINLPSYKIIRELNTLIAESEREFLTKCCFIIYPRAYLTSKKETTHPLSLELYSNDYIELNWLILSSCCLWYCNTEKEKEIRINQIFDILEKIEFIEEQALYFIFHYLYKYGNKAHFIRIFEILLRFKGYYSYHDLALLYDKLNNNINNNKDININIDINNNINKRSLLNIGKYINNNDIDDKIKEKIIFYNEQICEKCKKNIILNEQEISDVIKKLLKEKIILFLNVKIVNAILLILE